MMGGRNRRRKCEGVLEYTRMKSDEMPHVNICRVTEAPFSQEWQGGFVQCQVHLLKTVLWGNENEEEMERCFGLVMTICTF